MGKKISNTPFWNKRPFGFGRFEFKAPRGAFLNFKKNLMGELGFSGQVIKITPPGQIAKPRKGNPGGQKKLGGVKKKPPGDKKAKKEKKGKQGAEPKSRGKKPRAGQGKGG